MTDEATPGAPGFLRVGAHDIAFRNRAATAPGGPGIVWLGGWRSDMLGGKAEAMDALCAERGWSFLRHDYSGHGESSGAIEDGTISDWVAQSLAVLDAQGAKGRHLLCGSSMGAWIALRMVEELAARGETGRLTGLLLVAPAPDFTTRLMEPRMGEEARRALAETARWEEPSDYSDEPNVWTRAFMEDGARNQVLTQSLMLGVPVHIVQGTDDAEVPLAHAELLLSHLPADEATMTVVRGGDHRLSREEDLALLTRIAAGMVEAGTAERAEA